MLLIILHDHLLPYNLIKTIAHHWLPWLLLMGILYLSEIVRLRSYFYKSTLLWLCTYSVCSCVSRDVQDLDVQYLSHFYNSVSFHLSIFIKHLILVRVPVRPGKSTGRASGLEIWVMRVIMLKSHSLKYWFAPFLQNIITVTWKPFSATWKKMKLRSMA